MREVRLSAFAGTALAGIALAGATLLAGTTATRAADLPLPPPVYEPAPPPVAIGGGWYLRGDVGVTNQQLKSLTQREFDERDREEGNTINFLKSKFRPAATVGVGVGYQVNNWFRTDITGEYRTSSRYSGHERVTGPDGSLTSENFFRARKTEWVGLVNAYLDLGTWGGFTPYIGAGIGIANVRISGFTDTNPNGTIARAPSGSRNNFAWALHTGFAYQFTDAMSLDVGYRYLNMGRGQTGGPPRAITPNAPPPITVSPWKFNRIDSHDVRVGLRWMLDAPAPAPVYWDEPAIRKH
jgi:opacity protein-like surface antigen